MRIKPLCLGDRGSGVQISPLRPSFQGNKPRIATGLPPKTRRKMSQQWFSVIGLLLDFGGLLLVVLEWWRAFSSQIHGLARGSGCLLLTQSGLLGLVAA